MTTQMIPCPALLKMIRYLAERCSSEALKRAGVLVAGTSPALNFLTQSELEEEAERKAQELACASYWDRVIAPAMRELRRADPRSIFPYN